MADSFDIKDSLKQHYLFDYPIMQLIETFVIVFNYDKKELLRKYSNRLDLIYGELDFSLTIYNISEMIVYKYFNDDLSFAERAFIRCEKFKEFPFSNKIKELT